MAECLLYIRIISLQSRFNLGHFQREQLNFEQRPGGLITVWLEMTDRVCLPFSICRVSIVTPGLVCWDRKIFSSFSRTFPTKDRDTDFWPWNLCLSDNQQIAEFKMIGMEISTGNNQNIYDEGSPVNNVFNVIIDS